MKEEKMPNEDPQYLFSGLNSLIIGLGLDGILEKFRTPFEEWLKKSGKKVSDIKPEELYEYNPKLDVRVIQQNDGDGKFYNVNQTFDDYFVSYIHRERQEILDTLRKIAYDSVSYDSLKIRMQHFLKELPTFQIKSENRNWEPLTEKSLNYIDETLNEIREYICSQLELKEEFKRPSTGVSTQTHKNYDPDLVDSPLATNYPAKIRKLYKALSEIFIQDEEDRSQVFIDFLSGNAIPLKDNRIKWNNQRALKYLIYELETCEVTISPYKIGDLVFKFPRNKWQVVKKYFVQVNGSELDHISRENKLLCEKKQRVINRIMDKIKF